MQTPDSNEPKTLNEHTATLPLLSQDGENKDYQADIQGKSSEACPTAVPRSPECNDIGTQVENTWNETLNLPENNLQRLEESLIIEGYEHIGREEEHGVQLESNSSVCIENYSTFNPSPEPNKEQSSPGENVNDDEHVRPVQRIDLDECLEWPIINQESSTFNELSDVLLDSYRLNRETSFLLKMMDEDNIPQTVVVCVGNEDQTKNADSQIATQSELNKDEDQLDSFGISNSDVIDSYPNGPSLDGSESIFGYNVDDAEISRTLELQENLDYIASLERMDHLSNYQTIYETKAERYKKRKEKNRECSRLFRFKQRLKEDALKKGKLEKELYLRRLIHERERLRCALIELRRNCTSCSKAMTILSDFRATTEKENLPITSGMHFS